MESLRKFALICIVATATTLCSCTFPIRAGYNRKSGSYKHVPQASDIAYIEENSVEVLPDSVQVKAKAASDSIKIASSFSVAKSDSSAKKTETDSIKTQTASSTSAISVSSSSSAKKEKTTTEKTKRQQVKHRESLEEYARKWLGAKYVYGAASKKKTDCSGYVMQVYKGYYNIALDHNASSMNKDNRGKSISRKNLKEGDLVFFGGFWRIDHVGIYLKGNRFIHASTSSGVIITSMDDKYWSSKFKGAKRFKKWKFNDTV